MLRVFKSIASTVVTVLEIIDQWVRKIEPYSILIAAIAFIWALNEFRLEREDRKRDDISRAFSAFAENAGRREILDVLRRNDVELVGLLAKDAYLRDADLEGVDLSDAVFIGADLRGANLSHAVLSGADFRDAKLERADVSGTDLSGAVLTDADLSGVDFNRATICRTLMSDGSTCDRDCDPAGACSWLLSQPRK